MSRVAPIVPAESDLLCEGCGYTLNGLPEGGRCPECGKPLAESIDAKRTAPLWEHPEIHRLAGFIFTTAAVLFRPTRFYRTLATRLDDRPAKAFARIHWVLAAILFGASAFVHMATMGTFFLPVGARFGFPAALWILLPLIIGAFSLLEALTWLASKLTNWEATYRGLRMPIGVVRRGMYYHAAHYLPVGVIALATVVGYQFVRAGGRYDVRYLYLLAAEVILAAIYLFQTYWIGMRNMMYANR